MLRKQTTLASSEAAKQKHFPQEKNQNIGSTTTQQSFSNNHHKKVTMAAINKRYIQNESRPNQRWYKPEPRSYSESSENSYFYATHKFIISNWTEDLLIDPGYSIPWQDIDAVIVETRDEVSCPICLDQPTTPRMDSCGHIYCHHCLLQYFSSLKNPPKAKCTICCQEIELARVKRAVIKNLTWFKPGDEITFTRVSRPFDKIIVNKADNQCLWDFTRFQPSSLKALSKLLNDELNCIKNLICIYQLESFADETMPFLKTSKHKVMNELNSLTKRTFKDGHFDQLPSKVISYYQENNGRDVYLDPFTWKLITSQYAHLNEEMPEDIKFSVTSITTLTMDSDLRRRYKHLNHIPNGREFSFVEVDLKDFLSEEVVKAFQDQIVRREKIRCRKIEEEKKLDAIKIEQENKIPNLPVGFRLHAPAKLNFDDDFIPLSQAYGQINQAKNDPVTFAHITKSGVLKTIDNQTRVGKWGRNSNTIIGNTELKLAEVKWPTLSDSKKN